MAASPVLDPEGEKGGGYGVFTEGFKGRGSYWRGSNRRPLPLTEREGEIREKMVLTGGVHLSVERERGDAGEAGLVSFPGWLDRFGPRVRPSWVVPFFFLFFFLF
jgi:hypothetical protein